MAVLRRPDGTVLCARCEIADRPLVRMRGLLGRTGLAPDEGMLFRPAGSIHMFFMRFPIDVVFCDSGLTVLKIVPNLRPWRLAAARGAKVTIELAVGAARDLARGDCLVLDLDAAG
jgi:uncharacterized membrane protein (UPF0127 family)